MLQSSFPDKVCNVASCWIYIGIIEKQVSEGKKQYYFAIYPPHVENYLTDCRIAENTNSLYFRHSRDET
jgi:hypothetical protein